MATDEADDDDDHDGTCDNCTEPDKKQHEDKVRLIWAEPEFNHDVRTKSDPMLNLVDNRTEVTHTTMNTSESCRCL